MDKKDIKLLFVEDDPLIRDLLESTFSCRGWQVTAEASPLKALERLKDDCSGGRRWIVFSDIGMPEMNGLTFLKRVAQSAMPVVLAAGLLSGEISRTSPEIQSLTQTFEGAGRPFFKVDKPFHPALLHEGLLEAIAHPTRFSRLKEPPN